MSGERHAIEHPLFLDFSSQATPPLKTVVQTTYTPFGPVERPSPGITACRNDWYTELAIELKAVEAIAVLYLIPLERDSGLLVASMDRAFESVFKWASGADHGDGVTKVVAQHWPDVYEMLVRSNRKVDEIDGRILGNVITKGRVQWVVAEPVREGDAKLDDGNHLMDLIATTVKISLIATDPIRLLDTLPGFLQVLAGPDQTTRRLKAITKTLESPEQFAGAFEGGMEPSEWVKLGKTVLDALRSD